MFIGLIGIKCGMTRTFNLEKQEFIPITVLEIISNRIVQKKTLQKDGYNAIQITYGSVKIKKLSKALKGHYIKYNATPGFGLREFKIDSKILEMDFEVKTSFDFNIFNQIKRIKVVSISKGHGFSGTIKRHNFSSQRASHGNSLSHRAPGSIGQNQSPGKVFRGKKMAGRFGNQVCTIKNLNIIKVFPEKNLLFIAGSIAGFNGQFVSIYPQ